MNLSESEWNLSKNENIVKWLRRCKLPSTPLVVYLLRSEAYEFIKKKRPELRVHEETFFPFYPPDIDTIPIALGHPISADEARRYLIQDTIDVKKIPSPQRPSIDISKKTLNDFVLLQEIPFSDCIQIKHTGEIISKETFELLLRNNTTTWMGKESVGFKTPLDTLFGNLVSFNYDLQNYFPQKSGTLTVTRIPNTGQVPSQDKPLVIPTHYFKLEYSHHKSYLPDTKEGRLILALMKDAFKKGNLYGFSKRGSVRQGRIHKKTSLSGTYGYPDNTYLERVMGELRSIGSSPFIVQFAPYFSLDLKSDPYPQEKRFVLRFS